MHPSEMTTKIFTALKLFNLKKVYKMKPDIAKLDELSIIPIISSEILLDLKSDYNITWLKYWMFPKIAVS